MAPAMQTSRKRNPEFSSIAPAKTSDASEIRELNKLFHLDADDFIWDQLEYINEAIQNGQYFVILDSVGIAAALCVHNYEDDGYSEIATIAVRQDLQGKGLGKRLVNFARDQARLAGSSELIVGSFREYDLKDFYENCGFKSDPGMKKWQGRPYFLFSMNLE